MKAAGIGLLACLAFGASVVQPSVAYAGASYDFCVNVHSNAQNLMLHARVNYGDVDGGAAMAQAVLVAHYKDQGDVSVSDYNQSRCPGPAIQDVQTTASLEQVQRFTNAIGQGDAVSATVVAGEVAVGVTVSTIEGTASAAQQAGQVVVSVIQGIGHALGF